MEERANCFSKASLFCSLDLRAVFVGSDLAGWCCALVVGCLAAAGGRWTKEVGVKVCHLVNFL